MPAKGSRTKLSTVLSGGVKDLPRNTSWLLSKALSAGGGNGTGPVRGVAEKSADLVRSAGAAVKEAVPGAGDSVELRLQRARVAAQRARAAEDRALQAAEEAKTRSTEAKELAERDKAHLRDLRRDQTKQVEQRVAAARQAADAQVEQARREAQSDADEVLAHEEADADKRRQQALEQADATQQRAEQEVSEATSRLAEARQLADEATTAAQAAAKEAHLQAEQLAADAHHDAKSADGAVAEAERVQSEAAKTATVMAKQLKKGDTPVDLDSLSKRELQQLAKASDVEGRSTMSKDELVGVLTTSRR